MNEIYISCVLVEMKSIPVFYKFIAIKQYPYKKYIHFIVIEYIDNYITLQKYFLRNIL